MAKECLDVIDSQIIAENVGFLDNCFDNSFALQSSLIAVKEYATEEENKPSLTKLTGSQTYTKINRTISNKTFSLDHTTRSSTGKLSQSLTNDPFTHKELKDWGLPSEIVKQYDQRGIKRMFDWQVTCLGNFKVLMDYSNLVYSAPTSAGKTLVAEILTIKTILERQKKVIIILPFVSIVREKMFYLQDILSSSGIRVEGFMGAQSPPGGLQAVHVAICTIEKANSLINKLLDEGNISELGAVVVDELHLLGDPHRGYILELLLTKIKYVCSRRDNVQIQIVGMSATLPNLEVLAQWLDAELFVTQFRPIPLDEFCLVGNKLYNKCGKIVRNSTDLIGKDDSDNVLKICLSTIRDSCSVLIFCMTKNRCENLATCLASSFYKLGCVGDENGLVLRQQLNSESISEVLEQLKNCPVGLDPILKNTVSFGVAYHHAGLTFDERDIIEGGFKSGAIRVLIATSTLSSGVNLPARKVIIRSPVFQKQPINILTYKQMIGRAGRMGKDTKGESILICMESEKKIGFDLMMGALDPVKSCIEGEDKFMRAVLEMIASQVASSVDELCLYSKCTLLFTQKSVAESDNSLLEKTLNQLKNFELVREQKGEEGTRYIATALGKACLSSSMAPNDGLSLFCELQKARQCVVLETDLHLIYLVTPYSVSSQWADIDWLHLLTLWQSLTRAMKKVGELVGVEESFIVLCLRGTNKNFLNKLNVHKRFYTALALQDLVNEVPLSEVAAKFQCARGFLQSLQQAAATFAGMVTAFCHQLGWKNMEMLISQFQDRLHFGIHSELIELMKLPTLNGTRARTLFDAGFETIASIASADAGSIENALLKSAPFQSEKEREGDDNEDMRKRKKLKNIWITGHCGMTAREAAENLVAEARKYLQLEIGVTEIKWDKTQINESSTETGVIETVTVTENNFENPSNDVADKIESQSSTRDKEQEISSQPLDTEIKNESDVIIVRPKKEADNNNTDGANLSMHNDKDEFDSGVKDDDIFDNSHEDIKLKTGYDRMFKSSNLVVSSPILSSKLDNRDLSLPLKSTLNLMSPSILRDDIEWDTMIFTEPNKMCTEASIENMKPSCSAQSFSPNVSFGEPDEKSLASSNCNQKFVSCKSATAKDISLFSSEGDASSLFEESLPLDMLPSKLDNNNTETAKISKQETALDFENINSNTIMNAFKSTIIEAEVDTDEDIKLVYDDDIKESDNDLENGFNASEDNAPEDHFSEDPEVVLETQNVNKPKVNGNYISPFKRHIEGDRKDITQPAAKKAKLAKKRSLETKTSNNPQLSCKESKLLTLVISKKTCNCYILKQDDIFNNFHIIDAVNEASIHLNINTTQIKASSEIIGSNVVNKTKEVKEPKQMPLINGISFYFGQDSIIYLDLASLQDLNLVKEKAMTWLKRESTKLRVLYLKSDYKNIKKCLGIDLMTDCIDVSIAEWLIHSDEKFPAITCLMKKYCQIDIQSCAIKINNTVKKWKSLDPIESSILKAWCVWKVADKLDSNLSEKYPSLRTVMDIELKIARILAQCECNGVGVDKAVASRLLVDVKNAQDTLQRKAHKMCGYHFNFNSSKEVAKVLGMYKGRAVSTKKSVLTSHNSPMASIVIFWRKLNAILTKTLYPLTEKACIYSEGDRITTSYTMYTCTGRISMHEPSLQSVPRTFTVPAEYLSNLPSGDLVEFNCRRIFVASPEHTLVSADYCQLEMRILTHYCEDQELLRIMRSDADVFRAIAASWGGVEEDKVDDDLRQKAKQICYGILYGMGSKALAQQSDITEAEAAAFMESFYNAYPAIREFKQKVLEDCRKKGFVESLMGRRRYLPDINCAVASRKSAAERQAVNTTIQGSAADIAKAAMCAVEAKTTLSPQQKPRLILQMHDELIYEVLEKEKHTFMILLKKVMEDTVKLNVPLPVKVRTGKNWGSLVEVKSL